MKRTALVTKTPMKRSSPMARTAKPASGKPKARKCANRACRAPYLPAASTPWQTWCNEDCAVVIALDKVAKQKAAKAKAERAADKAKMEKYKRRPAYVADAQTAFNAYIRERDKDMPCICCGSVKVSGAAALHGGGWDAGHYISRGHASHLRFDERNVHKQRKGCNRPGGSNRQKFRAGIVARYGEQYVAELEALEYTPPTRDLTKEELVAIKETYQRKLKELKGRA